MATDPNAGSSFDKMEETNLIQKQIKSYQHRYKIALNDKMPTKEKLDKKLYKQRMILEKFQEDRNDLISKTFITEQGRRKEIEFLENLVDYIREKAFLENEVKNVREEMKELDKRNKTLEREIKKRTMENIKKKARLSGVDSSNERAEATVNTLENKLSQARSCLNDVVMVCKQYRKEIDECLLERQNFRVMLDSVMTKLKVGKACMLDMIEQAAVATAKRENARERLKKLVAEHKLITAKQAFLFRELQSSINVLIERAMFQSIKIQKRVMRGLEAKRQLSALIKRQDIENQILQAKLLMNHLKHLFRVEDYRDIGKAYNDTNGVITSYLTYALYSFKESDHVHENNALLQFSCDTIKQVTNDLINNDYAKVFEIQIKYDKLQGDIEELEQRLEYARTLKEFVVLRLNMMFHKAGCSVHRFDKLLGDHTKIDSDNAVLMVKEIERRIVTLVGMLYMVEHLLSKDDLPLKRLLLYLPEGEDNMTAKMRFFGLGVKTPCPVCAEAEHFGLRKESKDVVEPFNKARDNFLSKIDTEEVANHLHSVSHCHLPGSRRLLQQRFLKLGY